MLIKTEFYMSRATEERLEFWIAREPEEIADEMNRHVCSYLRLLVKIGGNHIAADLIKQLMFEHMRKPAFREELQKVKVK